MENENTTAQPEKSDEEKLAYACNCAFSAFRNYVEQSEDYKLLSQYAPEKASLLADIKNINDISLGFCPQIMNVRIHSTAWGSVNYVGSELTTRIKKSFSYECLVWANKEDLSTNDFDMVMKKANLGVNIYKPDEYSLKHLQKSNGKEALNDEVAGWSGVYADLERVTYDSLEKLSPPVTVGIFPIHIKQADGSDFTVGLLDAREEAIVAEIFPMGNNAKTAEERRLKRKRRLKIILNVVGGVLLALAITLTVLLV